MKLQGNTLSPPRLYSDNYSISDVINIYNTHLKEIVQELQDGIFNNQQSLAGLSDIIKENLNYNDIYVSAIKHALEINKSNTDKSD